MRASAGNVVTDTAQILDGIIESADIKDGEVSAADIAAAAVEAAKIAAGAVEEAKIAADAVTLAKMAAGTPGNLITYDASGDPAAVATGAAGQILTSQGAGLPPTMQDPTAVTTAEFTIWPLATTTNQTSPVFSWDGVNASRLYAQAGSSKELQFWFKVPHDFSSLDSIKIWLWPDATETIQYDVNSTWAADGEAHNTHTDSITDGTKSVTANQIDTVDISDAFTDLAADDGVWFEFGSDTATLRVMGAVVKYTPA